MATQLKRDYSLSGGFADAIALDDDLIEERVHETWWSPEIPRKQLKALMQRTDGPALRHFALWIVLLVVSGYIAVLSWGTWWAIPAFLIYGTIYSSSDARWHECGHGTPFRTRWLNTFFYQISSFMTLREAVLWRWSHARHHTDTIIVGRDPEIQVQRPADLLKIAMDFFICGAVPQKSGALSAMLLEGRILMSAILCRNNELQRMYWSSRIYVAIIAGFAAWSLAIGSFLPMMFVALPRFYGGWLHQLLGLTQHAGLGENTLDHRQNTRTVYINPVFRYLYMNMNYHIEHHSTPMVPYHALPRYHEAIKDQTPTPYASLWEVYKEMIPALIKQATEDPDYHIKRVLPAPTMTPAMDTGMTADKAADAPHTVVQDWVDVCAADELDEEDVIGFEHNGTTYAIYRLIGDAYYASDGLCTHERKSLAGGLVIDGCIECPKHNGRFDIVTGKAVRRPVRNDIATYPAERRGDRIFICISD